MYRRSSGSRPTSYTGTTPGCWSWPAICASSTNRRTISGLVRCFSRSTFTATSRPRSTSRPLSTTPMPPRASSPCSWYRPASPAEAGMASEHATAGRSAGAEPSRSSTRGTGPTARPTVESTPEFRDGGRLDDVPLVPPPASGPPRSPCPNRQLGQSPAGAFATREAPQRGQAFAGSMFALRSRLEPVCNASGCRAYPSTPSSRKRWPAVTAGLNLVPPRSRPQHGEQVPDLVVDLGRVGQRGRDLMP
jgi:hypothetical protein